MTCAVNGCDLPGSTFAVSGVTETIGPFGTTVTWAGAQRLCSPKRQQADTGTVVLLCTEAGAV